MQDARGAGEIHGPFVIARGRRITDLERSGSDVRLGYSQARSGNHANGAAAIDGQDIGECRAGAIDLGDPAIRHVGVIRGGRNGRRRPIRGGKPGVRAWIVPGGLSGKPARRSGEKQGDRGGQGERPVGAHTIKRDRVFLYFAVCRYLRRGNVPDGKISSLFRRRRRMSLSVANGASSAALSARVPHSRSLDCDCDRERLGGPGK